MTVEDRRGVGSGDQFPVGLRVLAVDDDRACLKLLEALLRRCQYHVTATNQAIDALKLLRDNKNKFDLVISDVHMPDMDGFKLLELVGLEMDLPVIMLSGNSDPKAVMKGITHGACDYLLKPVRLEELKNIWQHVVRRKRFDSRDVNSYDPVDDGGERSNQVSSEGAGAGGGHHHVGAAGPGPTASSELNTERTSSRKRKDQNEDDDDDFDEDGRDNDDSSMQKKPRVVWSIELHRKFVAAVNQLGIDKAMPKRILDLMNDEKLTRENVASHLQKYRLYLKRISSVTSQQANMVAVLGGKDSPYLQIGSSLENVRNNYHSFAGSGNLSTLASFQQGCGSGGGGMFGILNCPTGPSSASGLYNLASSGMIQLGYGRSNNNPPPPPPPPPPVHDLGRLQQSISFAGGGVEGLPPKMGCSSDVGKPSPVGNSGGNSFLNTLNNNTPTPLLQVAASTPQAKQHSGLFRNQPILASASTSRIAATLSGDPFEMKTGCSSFQTDFRSRPHNDTSTSPSWTGGGGSAGAGASSLTGYTTNTWYENLPSANLRENITAMSADVDRNNNIHDTCSSNAVMSSLQPNMLASLPLSSSNDRLGLSDIIAGGSSSKPVPTAASWFVGATQMTNFNYNSPSNSAVATGNQDDLMINNNNTTSLDIVGMGNGSFNSLAPIYIPQNSELDQVVDSKDGYLFGDAPRLQGGEGGGFDDLINAIVKREREDVLMEGDVYSLETCM